MIRFEWDIQKNSINERKHGLNFEEAQEVFEDPFARLIADQDHSLGEDRFVLMGMSHRQNTIVVCHCYRRRNKVIRIISARRATPFERKQYEEFRYEKGI
ncbi:MAG: hypothetical protein ACD_62C00303G0002 [uncultured bacterium]|nr:MAG: hypothetical protein ACD_62C00303G0002 [uncultured bacterium]